MTTSELDRVASVREHEVQWGDLDSAGIVYYPNFYSWADAATHRMFREAGLPMDRLLVERKMSFGLVASSADFQSPARYADRLVYKTVISKLGGRSIEMTHRIVRADGETPVATVRETRVCMDMSTPGKIRAQTLPEDVTAALRRFVAEGA